MATKKKKKKVAYECSACGAAHARWVGRCGTCGEWNSVEEAKAAPTQASKERSGGTSKARPLREVDLEDAERLPTGIGELDRALGGGPVRGGVILLGGDPGIGKSTLLMQALAALSQAGNEVLYVTGEESASQVALRARRLDAPGALDVHILATTELQDAENALIDGSPTVAVIDSIQTLRDSELSNAPGSVTQLRSVASRLIDLAKRRRIALFLIGHVTKDGTIAGPKVLEHLVDTVLAFEGDPTHAFRIVRANKNRFGPAQEIGIFEMAGVGLREVPDPSALFLAERPDATSGSVVAPIAEATRPMLVELQALVAPAAYGAPRRVVTGVDGNRLAILLAVLERRARMRILDRDVFASATGGVRATERALDLPLALAVVSSLKDVPMDPETVAFGEVGLAGEVRAVPRPGARIAEARKLGFRRIVLPKANANTLNPDEKEGVELIPVQALAGAIAKMF